MMIATEVYRNLGTKYFIFMDNVGNVTIMACDSRWSKQTIKPCSSPTLSNPDGNIISFTYKQDASDIITKVAIYDSKGNSVDISNGGTTDSTDEESRDDGE